MKNKKSILIILLFLPKKYSQDFTTNVHTYINFHYTHINISTQFLNFLFGNTNFKTANTSNC